MRKSKEDPAPCEFFCVSRCCVAQVIEWKQKSGARDDPNYLMEWRGNTTEKDSLSCLWVWLSRPRLLGSVAARTRKMERRKEERKSAKFVRGCLVTVPWMVYSACLWVGFPSSGPWSRLMWDAIYVGRIDLSDPVQPNRCAMK